MGIQYIMVCNKTQGQLPLPCAGIIRKVIDVLCWYASLSRETTILLSLAGILLAGLLSTRLTRLLRLPNVTGYILAGILIGPYVLGLIPGETVQSMDFVSDIALAFIAFGVGRFFRREALRETGGAVLVITVLEAMAAGVLVAAAMYFLFHMDPAFSALLGAIATATAPASTMMTIEQYHAGGKFVNLLLQIVALDDVVCLVVFSAAAAFVTAADGGAATAAGAAVPIALNLAALLLGALSGLLLSRALRPGRGRDSRLILSASMLVGLSGLCAALNVSPLLSCMVFGAVYINRTGDRALYEELNDFTPPIMSLFFVVSGMNLDVGALPALGAVGAAYFAIRIIGKYAGAWLGCAVAGTDRATRVYLGGALVPQAGVAIGLAYLGQRILPEHYGNLLMTIILASSVLYELIGPACAKFCLLRSGAVPEGAQRRKPDSGREAPPRQPLLRASETLH